jgi:hypothetical protein
MSLDRSMQPITAAVQRMADAQAPLIDIIEWE